MDTASATMAKRDTDLDVRLTIPLDALVISQPLPELLSQRNVEAVTGMDADRYRKLVGAPGFPLAVSRVGRLVFVDRAEFVAWIRAKATPRAPVPPLGETTRDAALEARFGFKTAPAQPKKTRR